MYVIIILIIEVNMNPEQLEAYNKRLDSKKLEMYQKYLAEKLDLVFNSDIGEESYNLIDGKVQNDLDTSIPYPGEYYLIDDEFEEEIDEEVEASEEEAADGEDED